jgi:serine/threonine protein kinase
MGTVWLGRDEVLGRAVAIKSVGMLPGAGSPDLARAEREARLAARLNHPHVVAVFDLVVEDDQQWLVMEYVEHRTLGGLVTEHGPLPADRAAPLLAQAADALAAAHAAGIVHRDVKPSNILVTPHGQVKLTDFGIARAAADASLTQTGLVTGSPAYLAPEVASGQAATTASDVWSLGATLYHALSGRPPYDVGENLMGALYRIVHEEPPRLPDAGWLAPLLEATMARDPADRWPMSQVRDALRSGTTQAAATPTLAFPAGPTAPTPTVAPPAPPPAAPSGGEVAASPPAEPVGPGRRSGALALLAGLAALVVVGLLAWSFLGGNDDPGRGSPPAARDSTPGGSPAASSPSGASSSASSGPTATGMRDFIDTYLATVTTDPRTAFGMLTPRFQAQSGGFGGYEGFWGTIRSARVESFTSTDPEALTIGYVVRYTRQDGSTATDRPSLQLVFQGGRYRIAGES